MGNYTAAQVAAINSGRARFRGLWTLYYPIVPKGPKTSTEVIDNGLDKIRIVDAGSRESVAYNQTLQKPGEFRTNNYKFSVANPDNYYSFQTAGSIWDKAYMLDPVECNIRHQVYIGIDGVFEELAFLDYRGAIEDISYESTGSEGEALNKVALFTCNNRIMTTIGSKVWDSDDGTDTDTGETFTTSEAP